MGNYAGLVLNGAQFNNDEAGYAVSGIGDVNGDGFADIAVSATYADTSIAGPYGYDQNFRDSGAVYVVFGTDQGFDTSVDLEALDGTDGFQITPEAGFTLGNGFQGDGYFFANGTNFGIDVTGLGDVNGDGFDDFAIGQEATSRDYNYGGGEYNTDLSNVKGLVYVVYGGTDPVNAVESVGDLSGFRIDVNGKVTSVEHVGDVNGDGFNDVGLNELDPFSGESSGFDITYVNDTNGNGVYDTDGTESSYTYYVEAQLGETSGFVIFGTDQARVSDVPIAIPGGNGPVLAASLLGTGPTSSTVIVNTTLLDGSDGFEVATGDTALAYVYFGYGNGGLSGGSGRLGSIGDINGDGFDDLINTNIESGIGFSAYAGYTAFYYNGTTTWDPYTPSLGGSSSTSGPFLIYGQDTSVDPIQALIPNTVNADTDYWVQGIGLFENFGDFGEPGGVGDVSGDDGLDDLAFGAFLSTTQTTAITTNARGVWLIDGTAAAPFTDNATQADPKIRVFDEDALLTGGGGTFFYDTSLSNFNTTGFYNQGAVGVGDVNNDGIDDILIGGSDQTEGQVGYLVFGQATPFSGLFDLATLASSGQGYKISFGAGIGFQSTINDVAGAGDLNADGFDDIIVGSDGSNILQEVPTRDGASVIFGGADALEALDAADGANDNVLDIANLGVDIVTGVLPIEVSVQNSGLYSSSQSEGDTGTTTFSFAVQRTGDLNEIVTVDYAVAGLGGNAADATDFVGGVLPSGTVNFAAGEAVALVTVDVQGDLIIESTETFSLTISNPTTDGTSPISITGDQSLGRIFNDDEATYVYVYGNSRNEDEDTDLVGFTVYRYGDIDSTVNVDYTITGGTAASDDVVGGLPLSGSVTIASGEFSVFIPVDPTNDTITETNETLNITLDSVTSPDSLSLITGNTTSTSYILNDDFPPRISVSVDSSFIQEGDSGTTPVTFTITRSGDITGTVDVSYDLNPVGTTFFALDSADIVGNLPDSGTVTFADGEFEKQVVVNVVGDTAIEPREAMELRVTDVNAQNGVSYELFNIARSVTVFNDDGRPPVIPTGVEADVFGDPHIITLDGLGYDFQAVGEYVLVETIPGQTNPFQVQVRFEPLTGSDLVSVTTRMAVDIGGTTLEIDAKGANPLLIGGVAIDANDLALGAVDVDGNGSYDVFFNETLSEFTVVLNDQNEQLMVKNMDGALNICVFLSDAADGNANGVRGLMGDADGDLSDDFQLRDGATIPASELSVDANGVPSLSFDYLYGRGAFDGAGYAGSWAVTTAEDMFSNSVTHATGFPAFSLKIDDIPDDLRAVAEAAALATGLDPAKTAIFEAAVLDFALTGDADFLAGASGLAAIPLAETTPTAAPVIVPTIGVATAEIDGALLEGDAGNSDTLFTFYRVGDASGALTVDYQLGGDVDAADLATGTSFTGSVTFADGQETASISIGVLGDLATEADEDITVTITGTDDAGVLIGASTATTTITTDDFAPEAADDAFSTDEDSAISGNVFVPNTEVADTDADQDSLSVVSVTDSDGVVHAANGSAITLPSGAILTISANGDFDFNAAGDGSGTDYDALDAVSVATETFTYVVSDGNGGTDEATVSVNIMGTNDGPQITSTAAVNAPENGTAATTVTASDAEGDTVTFSISGGDDANLFAIDGTTGDLTFQSAPDFETPGDADGDNIFDVQVSATDGTETTSQDIAVTVTDVVEGPPPNGSGEFLIMKFGSSVQDSNFVNNSFRLENSGDKVIVEAVIDVTGALYPDSVFDPFGVGGDSIAKELTINREGGTGAVTPTMASYVGAGGVDGYHGIRLTFDENVNGGFNPGEEVRFSIDMDPNSIAGTTKTPLDAGSSPAWDVGGVSGAELIGSTLTLTFADGTTATGQLHGADNQFGSKAFATQDSPNLSVDLTVNGLAPGDVGTYDASGPTVTISGPAGETARVVLTKGFIQPVVNLFDEPIASQLDAQLAALAATDFPANNAVEFQTVDILLDGTVQDISSLFDVSGVADYDFTGEDELPLGFVASVIDPNNDDFAIGPVTTPVYLEFSAVVGPTEGDDTLLGTSGDETIAALGGNDFVYTYEGNDSVDGGEGNDEIHGVEGMDTLNGDGGEDRIFGGDDADLINGGDDNDNLQGQSGDDTVNGDAGNDRVAGGSGADELNGGIGNDIVSGGTENDTLDGGEGDDRLYGQEDDDVISGGAGMDTVDGGAGNDILDGGDAFDRLYGRDGDDTINTGEGGGGVIGNIAIGGDGNDSITGGSGNERMNGEAGMDTLNGGGGDDQLNSGIDDDVINGDAGNDRLLAGAGNDTLDGGADNDTLFGGADDDVLNGGDGDDRIDGQDGSDIATGGSGADTFVWAHGAATNGDADVITDLDFTVDELIIRSFGGNPTSYIDSVAELYSLNLAGLTVEETGGGDTLITVDEGGTSHTLLLQGIFEDPFAIG